MLGNLTSSFGQLPAIGSGPTFSLPGSTLSSAGLTTPAASAGVAPASAVPAASASGTPATVASGPAATVWSSYLVRGVVIILGFIFIAVGLTMFAHGGTTVQAAKKITPGL